MSEINNTKLIVESLLFSSEKPLTLNRLKDIIGGDASVEQIKHAIDELNDIYATNHSFHINEVAGGFQIRTKQEYYPYLVRLNESRNEGVLSDAALETLSIIAYKQPIMRVEIDSIRGVDSSAIIRGLMEKKLARIAGRGESLGRPLLYGTTNNFLEILGLSSIKDLPKTEEVK